MRIVKFKKDELFPFLKRISEEADLWAPARKYSDRHNFKKIEDLSEIDLDYTRTLLPPRKIFLPPSFNMFNVDEEGYKENFSHATPKILFGIHPCDIHGLLILDAFFAQTFDDPYYTKARKNSLLIGHSCWPDEHCLCKSTGTHVIEEGYDLFFSELESYYLVWIGSSRGDDLVRTKEDSFDENISDKDIQAYTRWREEKDKAFKTEVNFIAMPDLLELKYKDDPLWEKLDAACLACGSCSNVCPTCNCYNVMDKPYLNKCGSDINRCWDACTLVEYSEVAGGENFREKKSDRLRLWYTHKLQAFISKYGKPACVGCGRCVITCPVDINIYTVAQSLAGEDVDAFWNRLHKEVTK